MANTTRITRRLVNSKRHTVGFVLTGGQQVSRSQAIQMASSGQIVGVRVVNGSQGRYLQATGNTSLYELPIAQQQSASRASRRSTPSSARSTSKAARRSSARRTSARQTSARQTPRQSN